MEEKYRICKRRVADISQVVPWISKKLQEGSAHMEL
jgi:hypothetical protein